MEKKHLAIPYILFLVIFVALPLVVIIYFGFTDTNGSISFENAASFFTNQKMIGTFLYSVYIGVVTTTVCLLIAFPIAYILAKGGFSSRQGLMLIFIMPMWINFTLRITALKEILSLIEGNIALHPHINTIIGMTYDFLPFMILPIYNAILKLPDNLLEVAQDLGAKPLSVIKRVVIPLSMPGILSGVTMVMLSSMTNYVVLDMVYNSTYIVGSLIGSYFSAFDWHRGAFISLILLVLIGFFTFGQSKVEKATGVAE